MLLQHCWQPVKLNSPTQALVKDLKYVELESSHSFSSYWLNLEFSQEDYKNDYRIDTSL